MKTYPYYNLGIIFTFVASTAFAQPNDLQIHYINVGQGGSTLIIGPNGTKILYDFGRVAGKLYIVPYLKETLGLIPETGIDYAIISHADKDHYMGYSDVVSKDAGGFNIFRANFEPGTTKTSVTYKKYALDPAKEKTTAGAFRPIPLGFDIDLGNGAQAIVMAANGSVFGDDTQSTTSKRNNGRDQGKINENDRSISLFIKYKKFQYILDGDLGSGPEPCSNHQTNQRDIQTKVARRLLNLGLMDEDYGVDVLHIAHHGSESSTSWKYYQLVKPEVGIISVGPDQGTFLHPRVDVVEKVLTCHTQDGKFDEFACSNIRGGDTRAPCLSIEARAPALKALYQTDYGFPGSSSTGSTSFLGNVAGDIKISTDGSSGYSVSWTGKTIPHETTLDFRPISPGKKQFDFDEDKKN